MRKFIYGFLLSLFVIGSCQAGLVSIYETYATNGQVTAANLNGNINNIVSVVNGGLDNNNVNTTTYRLLEILGSLPSASIVGRTVFLTTDSSLNFDSGSTWTKAITAAGTAVQGDMLYYSGTAWTRLGYGTSGYYLKTQGASANPAWADASNAATLDTYDTATSAGVNKIYVSGADNYLPDATVDTTALKTATGEVSGAAVLTLPGGEYGFYPQLKATAGSWTVAIFYPGGSLNTFYTTLLQIGGSEGTVYARQRYVTASGEDYWIFLLLDKTTKEIIGAYQAPDHPAYGNGGDFTKVSSPFLDYDETKQEIVILDKDTCNQLKQESEQTGKSILTLVNEDYKPTLNNEIYQPLHSGKYLKENKDGKQIQVKEMVQTIPDYIKVRKLVKLTSDDKFTKEAQRQWKLKEKKDKEDVEILINNKMREQAISELKTENKLDEQGKIKK